MRVVVRDIGRKGDLAEPFFGVRAGNGELAVGKDNIAVGSLHQVGGDDLGLVDHLVHGLGDRGTADRKRA